MQEISLPVRKDSVSVRGSAWTFDRCYRGKQAQIVCVHTQCAFKEGRCKLLVCSFTLHALECAVIEEAKCMIARKGQQKERARTLDQKVLADICV